MTTNPLRPFPSCRPASRHRTRIGAALVLAAACTAGPAFAQRAALTQNVDEPGRNPFALTRSLIAPVTSFAVPAGKRYVVDNYTVQCDVQVGHSLTVLQLFGVTTGIMSILTATPHYQTASLNNPGGTYNSYIGTGQGPMYADPGTVIYLVAQDDSQQRAIRQCDFYLAGHVINLP